MINLDQRPEKFAKSLEQLSPYGINPFRFSAVNGWELTLADIEDVSLKFQPGMQTGIMGTSYKLDDGLVPVHSMIDTVGKSYLCHGASRGVVGIVLSHMSILKDALDSGYDTIWVMEDDIEVMQNPNQLSDLINKLDKKIGRENWDILFTDPDTRDPNGNYIPARGHVKRPNFIPKNPQQYHVYEPVDELFIRCGARFGAYSMIIRKSGLEKIYNFIKDYSVFSAYDMDYYLPDEIKIYCLKTALVASDLLSITDNALPSYLNKKKTGF
jgi:GR25 family glycosyltransferase involved in LPS biosynthesis